MLGLENTCSVEECQTPYDGEDGEAELHVIAIKGLPTSIYFCKTHGKVAKTSCKYIAQWVNGEKVPK